MSYELIAMSRGWGLQVLPGPARAKGFGAAAAFNITTRFRPALQLVAQGFSNIASMSFHATIL